LKVSSVIVTVPKSGKLFTFFQKYKRPEGLY